MQKCKFELLLILIIEMFCMTMLFASLDVESVFLEPNALNPMTYPRILLFLMAGLAPFLVFSEKSPVDVQSLKFVFWDIAKLVLLMTGYWLLLPLLGFVFTAFLLCFLGTTILKYHGILKNLIFSAGISLGFWYLFTRIMLLSLPAGSLF